MNLQRPSSRMLTARAGIELQMMAPGLIDRGFAARQIPAPDAGLRGVKRLLAFAADRILARTEMRLDQAHHRMTCALQIHSPQPDIIAMRRVGGSCAKFEFA